MEPIGRGVYEASLDSGKVENGFRYKFKFRTKNGDIYRADPYARLYDGPPEMASRFYESAYSWGDGGWLNYRRESFPELYRKPMHVYEIHAGAWRHRKDGR